MGKMILRDALTSGMILEQSVVNKFGQTLMPAGIEFNEHKIELLKTWGIKAVWIHSVEELPTEMNEDDKRKVAMILRRKISWKPRNALEYELYNLAFQSTLTSLQSSQRETLDAARP